MSPDEPVFQRRAVAALADRGLRACAESPACAAAVFVFYLITGYLFAVPLGFLGQASIQPLMEFEPLLLAFLVPALTMGLLADELRSGTFETLATLPLEDWDIVLGKHLGFALYFAVAVAGLAALAVGCWALAAPGVGLDWGQAAGVLAATLLTGWLFGAIGLFASSLGRSQITGFVGAFLVCFSLLLIGRMAVFLPAGASAMAEFIGLENHLAALAKGVLDTRDLAYFATLIAAFLLLTVARLRARNPLAAATTALLIAALAALNVIARFAYARVDASAGRLYSLAPGSRRVLDRLSSELLVRAYYSADLPPPYRAARRYLQDLLDEYHAASRGRMRVEFIDPAGSARRRSEAEQAGIAAVPVNVMGRDRFEVKQVFMGLTLLYEGRSQVIPILAGDESLEYELTRRIKRLVDPRAKTVGFLSGHGEKDPGDPEASPFFRAVREEVDLSAASLAEGKAIPASVDGLWVLAPAVPFKAAELDKLRRWVASGKPLGLLLNRKRVDVEGFSAAPFQSGLEPLLKEWGLELSDAFVADPQCEKLQLQTRVGPLALARVVDEPLIPIVTRFAADHPATRSMPSATFPFVHALRAASPMPPGLAWTPLAFSTPDSWLREDGDLSAERAAQPPSGGAARGPFVVAGAVEGRFAGGARSGRVVVVATGYQVDPHFMGRASSLAFLLNLVDWSVEDDDLLSIRTKTPAYRPLRQLPPPFGALTRYALMLALPAAWLAAFAEITRRQRRRRRGAAARYAPAPAQTASVA